ncbi:MAG: WD40/YVTN/BNR-like repeat-containing protein [Saprospiraceae bacterium]
MKQAIPQILLLLLLGASPFSGFSQKVNVEQLKGIKTRNIGPAGMSGRVTAIDAVVADPNIIYVGTASGGVWKSVGGGTNWQPIFDKMPVQAIGAVKINQRNPSEIWVGTGEGNPRNSQNSGEGIYKSIDGGVTWKCMGLEKTKAIHRIIIHRDNPNTVFVAALGSSYGPTEDRGVFKTTDGGKTWRKILFANNLTGCSELVTDPANPNKLIAALWEYERKPWFFNSGGKGSGLYISHDGGDTWERRTSKDGLPEGDLGRMGIAIAPSSPNIVYALVEAKENALYKSTDGGLKWSKMASADKGSSNVGDRPFYYSEIYVDPKNENRIYSIYSFLSKSEDGGKSFNELAGWDWRIHPDHHALWINPNDASHLMNGNDGGLNISYDYGKTWRFADNLPVGQFYHVSYDMSVPYRIAGGMQDNGSWVGPSAVWRIGGIRNMDWQCVYFGDGFDVSIQPDNGRYCYAMSQGGYLGYVDMLTGHSQGIKPVHPDGKTKLRFHWNSGFAQNPFHNRGVYYGSQYLHKSMDSGQTWEIISPDLTTNDTSKLHQDKTGGLTPDATSAENHCTILAIAPSTVDEKVIWVGTDDGNVQLTRDGGKTWTNCTAKLPTVKPGSWVPYIEAGKRAGEAFVIVNDYRRNDWRPMAFFTKDFGATWTRLVDEKQVQGHALCIVQDPEADNLLFLGTDYGLWFSIDFGKNWNKWANDYPSVSTIDLKIHPREHDLIIGTFGRAFWVLDDIRPLREIARSQGKLLEQPFKVFPAPDAYLAAFRFFDGVIFPGDATFEGANRSPAAMLTFWAKPSLFKEEKKEPAKDEKKEAKKEEKKDDSKARIQIIDSQGDTIRTFSLKPDSCMNRITWGLEQDGVRYPSRNKPKPEDDKPGGNAVLPGKYKLLFKWKGHVDSTFVTVHADPRMNITMEARKAQMAAQKDFEKTVKAATNAFDRLQEAMQSIKLVNEALVNAPDSLKKDLAKQGQTMTDSIAALEKLFMQPEGQKGIPDETDDIQNALYTASGHLGASDGAPNSAARVYLEKSERMLAAAIGKINKFTEGSFAKYREQVEAAQSPLFKKWERLKVD